MVWGGLGEEGGVEEGGVCGGGSGGCGRGKGVVAHDAVAVVVFVAWVDVEDVSVGLSPGLGGVADVVAVEVAATCCGELGFVFAHDGEDGGGHEAFHYFRAGDLHDHGVALDAVHVVEVVGVFVGADLGYGVFGEAAVVADGFDSHLAGTPFSCLFLPQRFAVWSFLRGFSWCVGRSL